MPLLTGRKVLDVKVCERRLREPIAARVLARLQGATIIGIRRRSKYLPVDTDSRLTLLIHLGMTGQLGRRRRAGLNHRCANPRSGQADQPLQF